MNISHRMLFAILCLSAYTGVAQTRQQVADAAKSMYEANMRSLEEYGCSTALIQMDRQNILDRMNGRKPPVSRYDSMISRAGECLNNDAAVVAYYYRAKAYIGLNNNKAALADFEQAINISRAKPNVVVTMDEVLEERADLYISLGDREHAANDLREALKAQPNRSSAKDKLDHLDEKIANARKDAALANPQTAEDYVIVGKDREMHGKHDAAIAAFDKSLSLKPGADAYLGKGQTLQAMKRPAQAVDEFNKGLALSPDNKELLSFRGYSYRDLKRWDEAVADFNKALQKDRKDANLLVARGDAFLGKMDFSAAMKDFDAAIAASSDNVYTRLSAMAGKGNTLRDQGKTSEALAVYNDAIAGAGTDFIAQISLYDTYMGRGRLYAAAGQKAQAEADFKKAISLVGKSEEANEELAKLTSSASGLEGKTAEQWANEGRTQFSSRNYAEAVADFSKSIQLDPGNAFYYCLRGFANASAGNDEAFKSDFTKAQSLAPRDVTVYFLRGTVYEMKGNKTEAINDFRRVLEIDPNHENAKKKLQELSGQ